jgi:very-short-patch-repair endonuclease
MDYAWPEYKVALEIEGGVWTGGRHSNPSGFVGDMEKYNALACAGWRLIRIEPKGLLKASTVELIRAALSA